MLEVVPDDKVGNFILGHLMTFLDGYELGFKAAMPGVPKFPASE